MTLHRNRCFIIVEPPTDEDLRLVNEVIDGFAFPWEWTLHDNIKASGKADLPIGFGDKPSSWGYYNSSLNTVNVDSQSSLGSTTFRHVLAHEISHFVDDACLTYETRLTIHRMMHDGSRVAYEDCPTHMSNQTSTPTEKYEWGGGAPHSQKASEAFAYMLPHLFAPEHARNMNNYGPHYYNHRDEIRELVLADAVGRYPFDDIQGHTFEKDILWATTHGIAFGKGRTFDPDAPVTRGQMTAFIRRAISGLPEDFTMPDPSENTTFNDIGGHTFEADILWAARQGIAKGGGDGNFRPNDPVTRGAMTAFLHRALDPQTTAGVEG